MLQPPRERDNLDQSQPLGFGFKRGDGSANLFSNYFNAVYNRSPGHHVDLIAKGYERGNFDLVFKLRSYRTDSEYDLVFTPLNVFEELSLSAGAKSNLDQARMSHDATANHQSVLCLTTNSVEYPNKVTVPSLVRLESPKERVDFRWKGFPIGKPLPGQKIFKNVTVSATGK